MLRPSIPAWIFKTWFGLEEWDPTSHDRFAKLPLNERSSPPLPCRSESSVGQTSELVKTSRLCQDWVGLDLQGNLIQLYSFRGVFGDGPEYAPNANFSSSASEHPGRATRAAGGKGLRHN